MSPTPFCPLARKGAVGLLPPSVRPPLLGSRRTSVLPLDPVLQRHLVLLLERSGRVPVVGIGPVVAVVLLRVLLGVPVLALLPLVPLFISILPILVVVGVLVPLALLLILGDKVGRSLGSAGAASVRGEVLEGARARKCLQGCLRPLVLVRSRRRRHRRRC